MIIKSILIILIGAMIGWVTNYIAIKMLFRPRVEINFIFFKLQGVIPKKKHEIGQRIATVLKNKVISMTDILKSMDKKSLSTDFEKAIDTILADKIKVEIKKEFPMLAMFLNDSIIEKINNSIKNIFLSNQDKIVEILFTTLEKNVDIEKIIIANVDAFSLDELEDAVMTLAKNELKHIEIIGAVLGAIIGIVQVIVSIFI